MLVRGSVVVVGVYTTVVCVEGDEAARPRADEMADKHREVQASYVGACKLSQ
jgi:hypothetical protein